MKALTVCQPFAHQIAIGEKLSEFRTWCTSYRGPLLIHAGKSRSWLCDGDEELWPGMVFGAIVCKCELIDIQRDAPGAEVPEGYDWLLQDVKRFSTPIPYRGQRGLFDIPDDVVAEAVLWMTEKR